MAVALFNDTGDNPHVGCLAVSQAHRRMLDRAGAVVRHAFFHRHWHRLGAGTVEEAIEAALNCEPLMQAFSDVDAVVVNGEGSIHHRQGGHLIAILGAAQRAGVPAFLVNAVLQDVDGAAGVLAALTDCTVRDACSSRYLDALGVAHRRIPDSFFEAGFLESPRHDFSRSLVLTDCHPVRAAEYAPLFAGLRAAWSGAVVDYPLESPDRVADWQHAVADFRRAEVIVTGRHHGACLALMAGVPFVTLPSNTWKLQGLIDTLEGYPAEAADPSRSLAERAAAAMAHRRWFEEASARLRGDVPLATFDRLRTRPSVMAADRVSIAPADERTIRAVRLSARPGPVLHAGCGRGALLASLLASGCDATGVDVSAAVVADVRARFNGRCAQGSPDALPFDDGRFATVVAGAAWLEHLEDDRLPAAIAEIARVASDTVVVEMTGRPPRSLAAFREPRARAWWEARFGEHGLRTHTRVFAALPLEALAGDPRACLVMQRGPRERTADVLAARLPDATGARYDWACTWIKPGDIVVDAACGHGFGAAVLWDGSDAGRVIGLDRDRAAIDAARRGFAPGRSGVEFQSVGVDPWERWADQSVDCIVAVDAARDPATLIPFAAGAQRVLKPGGRILCALSADPDRGRAARLASLRVLVDQVVPQPACAGAWLFSAIKDPLAPASVPYVERVFPAETAQAPDAIAIGRDYVNPWAVHAIVSGQFRVRSPALLAELAARWLAVSPGESADAGAAMCVLAYRVMAGDDLSIAARSLRTQWPDLVSAIDAYCAAEPANPQMRRWQISLRFASGLLLMRRGDPAGAERRFLACAAEDATAFTPHLETKTTEAAWHAGRLALERGDAPAAAAAWRLAFRAIDRVRSAAVADWLITPERPAEFEFGDGLREIAVAIDNAAACANGLRRLHQSRSGWRRGARVIDSNFQQNIGRLLDEVQRRGGEIVALRAGLRRAQDQLRAAGGPLRPAADRQVGAAANSGPTRQEPFDRLPQRIQAERAALRKRLGHALRRVVVFGAGDHGRRAAEALAARGTTEIAGFVDFDEPCHGRTCLGAIVHEVAWLARSMWDVVAVATVDPDAALRHLQAAGITGDRIVVCPVHGDDEAIAAAVTAWFADRRTGARSGLRLGIVGTGAGGMKVWEGISAIESADVAWFADNDPARQGQTLLWLDVIAPARIPASACDAVVIGSLAREAIARQLIGLGVARDRILAPDVAAAVPHLRDELAALLADVGREVLHR